MASSNPNTLANILPGAGTSFAVKGDTEIQQNSIDSDCMKATVLKFKKVNLTSAQILALSATPVQLIAAPGAGYVITLHKMNLRMAPSGTAYANGGNVTAQYKTGTVAATNVIAASVVNAAGTTVTNTLRNGIDVAAVANSDLELTNAAAPFITGTGIAQVQLWYSITTLET